MNKKHALFLFGEYRTFDLTHQFYINNIPDNVDVYISTWNKSLETKKGYIKFNKELDKWEFFKIPYGDTKQFKRKRESSILAHRIDGIDKDVFEPIFSERLKNVSITNIEWNQYLDSRHDKENYTDSKFLGGTSSMIYHWKQLVSMVEKENQTYDMVIAMRLDAIPRFKYEPFTFSFELDEDTLYSSSADNMQDWTFFNDTHFVGNFKVIKKWIDNLDIRRDRITHEGIAVATEKMVNEGILKHSGLNGELNSLIIRRSLVPFIEELKTNKNIISRLESFLANLSKEEKYIIHENDYE